MGIFFALGFIFLFISFTRAMFVCFAACAALCVFIKNESNGDFVSPKENSSTQKLYIHHINLSNVTDINGLVKKILSKKSDVLSFQEVTPEWAQPLELALKNIYPHNFKAVRIDPFGKAIYSKYPFTISDTLNELFSFDIVAKVNKEGKVYTLISPYLTPALDNNSILQARQQMKNISQYVNTEDDNLIVIGDFNMVYWSQDISDFRASCDLHNGRKDVIPVSMKVPYDQVFYSKNLQCVSVQDLFINSGERVGITAVVQEALIAQPTTIKAGF
jgi:endonuclease/exonuclease/phosphatase (EEP) superfamily protein YafD